MTDLTDDKLDELIARRAAGTQGEWEVDDEELVTIYGGAWAVGHTALNAHVTDKESPRCGVENAALIAAAVNALPTLVSEVRALRSEVTEARRRRDEWKAKAEGYDTIRNALREKVGAPWPPNLSRALWAALAADEKKRADDADAEVRALRGALRLIELFGYREGEDFGWINAHMRGTATAALEGKDLAPYWRLFPNHRPHHTGGTP